MSTTAFDRLRALLNGAIKGPKTSAFLEGIAAGDASNEYNIQAVNEQLYISTATSRYLDRVAANIGFQRPLNIGLSDQAFSQLAISTTSKKQISSIMLDVLEVFYGPESTRATMIAGKAEPYALVNGDQLFLETESGKVTVTFKTSDFENISAAKASEIANVITREIRVQRTNESEILSYSAPFFDTDTKTFRVELVSGAKGPTSFIQCLGGAAQNALQFPNFLNTSQSPGTRWDVQKLAGATVRFTWIGNAPVTILTANRVSNVSTIATTIAHQFVVGQIVNISGVTNATFNGVFTITDVPTPTSFRYAQVLSNASSSGGLAQAYTPGLNLVEVGDIVNVYGLPFDLSNKGAYIVQTVIDGPINVAYFEILNEYAVTETVQQTTKYDVTFTRPTKQTILNSARYATVFEVTPGVIQVFIPATTQVVERQIIGAAHLQKDSTTTDFLGPYIYDTTRGGVLTEIGTNSASAVQSGQVSRIVEVANGQTFPDKEGFLVFGFGTKDEELPVKYIGRPNNQTLLIDPAHIFQKNHSIGSSIDLLSSRVAPEPAKDGSDYAFYLTGTANGRIYAENLIKTLAATGLTLIITVIYPGSIGLSKWGTEVDDKFYVWGGDE